MRARGFAGRAAAGAVGATATDSVAASICVCLRRRYTMPSCLQTDHELPVAYILAPIARASDQFGDRQATRCGNAMVTTKTPTKAKARTRVRASDKITR